MEDALRRQKRVFLSGHVRLSSHGGMVFPGIRATVLSDRAEWRMSCKDCDPSVPNIPTEHSQ